MALEISYKNESYRVPRQYAASSFHLDDLTSLFASTFHLDIGHFMILYRDQRKHLFSLASDQDYVNACHVLLQSAAQDLNGDAVLRFFAVDRASTPSPLPSPQKNALVAIARLPKSLLASGPLEDELARTDVRMFIFTDQTVGATVDRIFRCYTQAVDAAPLQPYDPSKYLLKIRGGAFDNKCCYLSDRLRIMDDYELVRECKYAKQTLFLEVVLESEDDKKSAACRPPTPC